MQSIAIFYRGAETGEINVVYRRDRGGFGAIQPRQNGSATNGHHLNGNSADRSAVPIKEAV